MSKLSWRQRRRFVLYLDSGRAAHISMYLTDKSNNRNIGYTVNVLEAINLRRIWTQKSGVANLDKGIRSESDYRIAWMGLWQT
eukprot:XP_001710235.1 Hypothetical protein GL50803_93361 [Giardia lamblia ATCC 50803]